MIYKFSVILIASGLLLFASACSKFQPLEYKGYSGFQISNENNSPRISTSVQLYNPNKWGGKLKEMDLDVELGNKNIGSINLDEPVKMPRKGMFSLPFSITTTYNDLTTAATGSILDAISGKPVPYNLEGTVTLQKWLIFKKTFDVEYTDSIRLKDLKF
jgi:hypothetical protein